MDGVSDDEGSVLPLTIGYALLAIVLILVTVDATSLALANKRVEAIADAAALAGADGFTIDTDGATADIVLTDAAVAEQAQAIVDAYGAATIVAAGTSDGVSARVTVAATWHPPVLTLFVPEGVPLLATATCRVALR